MTDRELLEQAAKAAGIARARWDHKYVCSLGHNILETDMWNPLTNDGDALRLAVRLEIDVDQILGEAVASRSGVNPKVDLTYEDYGDDPYAATRRAIVRAAAEIGKGMK